MDIEIVAQQDDAFRIVGLNKPAQLENLPAEIAVEEVPVDVVHTSQAKPAPIQNQRGLDWFNGTSWGNQ